MLIPASNAYRSTSIPFDQLAERCHLLGLGETALRLGEALRAGFELRLETFAEPHVLEREADHRGEGLHAGEVAFVGLQRCRPSARDGADDVALEADRRRELDAAAIERRRTHRIERAIDLHRERG